MNNYNWKSKNICNNCGIQGHLFFSCKRPIMSFGIICYRINDKNKIEYLLVRRKDSLGYVDFLRGKYNTFNNFHIKQLIREMTRTEILNIKKSEYSDLWYKLWNKQNEKYDEKVLEKFNYIKDKKLHLFDLDISNNWDEPEWGFPKGRRNPNESDYDCSIREFEEETGYSRKNLIIIKNVGFLEEVFTGSNAKSYKHKYYLCKIDFMNSLCETNYQKDEIGDLKWVSYNECLSKIRYYNYEKKKIIEDVNILINNNL